MTIAASTMAPSAIAIPPRLMMLEPMPSACMPAKAISTPIGSVRMATSALRDMQEEQHAHRGDDKAFLNKRAGERIESRAR